MPAVALLALGGCLHATLVQSSGVVTLNGAGRDLSCEVTLYGASFYERNADRPQLVADLGRCRITESGNGHGRLIYPIADQSGRPATQPGLVFSLAPGEPTGSIDLTTTDPPPLALPRPSGDSLGDAIATMFILPEFIGQPFAALPDRLANTLEVPGPVAPSLLELSHDLVDYKGTAAVGTLRTTGVFTVRLTLTDAGRAKLRAALARRSTRASTEPGGSAAGSPASRPAP